MKRIFIILFSISVMFSAFPASYDNNEHQKKSRFYMKCANNAFDEGDYDKAIEYSRLAEEEARKSEELIQKLLAKTEAELEMNRARTRYMWAKNNKAEQHYPEAFLQATEALNAGTSAFDNENYDIAKVCAVKVLEALGIVTGDEHGFAKLPAEYRVRTWRGEHDCLWSIAALPAVYNNPFMWKKLYDANKHKFPNPANPHLIKPGTILKIPSLYDEKRSGRYDHSKVYEKLPKKKQKKVKRKR